MKKYRIEYSAVTRDDLPPDAGERLARALEEMPGTSSFEGASASVDARRLSASFGLDVRLGMADAARDGSRLAKEAVKEAGFGAAQLVELRVQLAEAPQPSDDPASQWDKRDRSWTDGSGDRAG
ncbi:MAG: hypothetical protein ACR2N6_08720 [Miltoncostaeaceae bacterium]